MMSDSPTDSRFLLRLHLRPGTAMAFDLRRHLASEILRAVPACPPEPWRSRIDLARFGLLLFPVMAPAVFPAFDPRPMKAADFRPVWIVDSFAVRSSPFAAGSIDLGNFCSDSNRIGLAIAPADSAAAVVASGPFDLCRRNHFVTATAVGPDSGSGLLHLAADSSYSVAAVAAAVSVFVLDVASTARFSF